LGKKREVEIKTTSRVKCAPEVGHPLDLPSGLVAIPVEFSPVAIKIAGFLANFAALVARGGIVALVKITP